MGTHAPQGPTPSWRLLVVRTMRAKRLEDGLPALPLIHRLHRGGFQPRGSRTSSS